MSGGKFIVVEGIEGAGKSSAIAVIEQVLQQHQLPFIKTREPGGTPLAESLRALVKSADHQERITEQTELLLMYASRSQLIANRIAPALAAGTWVIGDRHDLSSQAYQGGGRQFDDHTMQTLAEITLKGFSPDLTILLDIEPALGLARANARGELDRIELETIEFFERVRAKYLALAQQNSNIVVIDASQAMAKVHQDVRQALQTFLTRTAP
jgi:dTMP kinase